VPSLTLLMWLSLAGVAALFVALALYVRAISQQLEEIGGPATRFYRPVNYLSKIRVGLRAIDVHTGHVAPQVTALNGTLERIRDGLRAVDAGLAKTIGNIQQQGR
jgi:hypothetical protein